MMDLPPETSRTARRNRRSLRDDGNTADRALAAFDFDGTLTRGGSVWQFLVAVRGYKAVAWATIPILPKLVCAALLGGSRSDRAKEALFTRTLAGLQASDVYGMAREFGIEHYRNHARTDTRTRLEWHRSEGHRLVIVSASPDCILQGIAELLEVDAVIATSLAVDEKGFLTGRYEGSNCRGEQKIQRVRSWMAGISSEGFDESDDSSTRPRNGAVGVAGSDVTAANVTTDRAELTDPSTTDGTTLKDTGSRPYLWAYGNSAGDRRLLAEADIGIDVGRLGRFGKLRGHARLKNIETPN